jgi:hypothetical protein
VISDAAGVRVRLEGHPGDLDAQAVAAGLTPVAAPELPDGPHRGRISVAPGLLAPLSAALDTVDGVRCVAEHGVGTVHVAADTGDGLAAARDLAHAHHGWLLREAGAPDLDPFGVDPPAVGLQRRIRAALDPTGKLAPGRLPVTEPVRRAA